MEKHAVSKNKTCPSCGYAYKPTYKLSSVIIVTILVFSLFNCTTCIWLSVFFPNALPKPSQPATPQSPNSTIRTTTTKPVTESNKPKLPPAIEFNSKTIAIPPEENSSTSRIAARFIPSPGFSSCYLILESTADGRLQLVVVESKESHAKIFSTRPATYVTVDGVEAVIVNDFFNDHLPAKLIFDDDVELSIQFKSASMAHTETIGKATQDRIRKQTSLKLDVFTALYGHRLITINMTEGTFSFPSPSSSEASAIQPQETETSALKAVSATLISGNNLSITEAKLIAKKNPHGAGYVVYTLKESGRFAIWFVLNGNAYALNHSSITASTAQRTRDNPAENWAKTNLGPEYMLTSEAIKIANR